MKYSVKWAALRIKNCNSKPKIRFGIKEKIDNNCSTNPLLCDDYETMEITADKSNLIRKDDDFIDLYELREIED